jgi:hypothetical protein
MKGSSMLSVENRLEITELYARYNVLVDNRDHAWAGVFTSDGVFSARGKEFAGVEGLNSYIDGLIAGTANATHVATQHWNANIILTEDSDEVRGTCYLVRVGKNVETGASEVITLGTYADRIVRDGDRWLFAERVVTIP